MRHAGSRNREQRHLLVIDELNRGDPARIFGELITLVEVSKRDRISAVLPYSKKEFSVPSNLYLLGTMNTADRSISLLDVAIRRRFAFKAVGPSEQVFGKNGNLAEVEGISLWKLLVGFNERLREVGIDADRAIGHSYFLIPESHSDPLSALASRIKYDILHVTLL